MEHHPGFANDRIFGCFAAGAIADALIIEADSSLWHSFGEIDRPPFAFVEPAKPQPLSTCANVRLTLFTTAGLFLGLASDRTNMDRAIKGLRSAYLEWYVAVSTKQPHPGGATMLARSPLIWDNGQGIAQQPLLSALALGAAGSCRTPANQHRGACGMLRVAPIGLVPGIPIEQTFELAAEASAITHGHPEAWLSAGAFAVIIRLAAEGEDLGVAVGAAAEMVASSTIADAVYRDPVAEVIRDARHLAFLHEFVEPPPPTSIEDVPFSGKGWTALETLCCGIRAAMVAKDLSDAVRIAAALPSDFRQGAVVAGHILGAARGSSFIPMETWARVDIRCHLASLANAFCSRFRIPLDNGLPSARANPILAVETVFGSATSSSRPIQSGRQRG